MSARRHAVPALLVLAATFAAACSNSVGVRATDRAATAQTGAGTPGTGPTDSTQTTDSTRTTDSAPPGTGAGTGDTIDMSGMHFTVTWAACTDPKATDKVLQCATLTVPLDYADPKGKSVDLALVKAPATSSRTGAILFNPGGPGGSGFDPIAESGTGIQSRMGLEHFDIIGFDPRGVDRSGGIRCVDDAFQNKYLYLDDTPDTPAAQQLLDEATAGFAKGCKDHYADTLRFYSTANTARDMEAIRMALGDEQISYLGISYGTYLGAVYATMFPDRVRAMVLDSAFEPNGDTVEQQWLTQLVGFEGAFNDWAAWCAGDTSCAFTAADVGKRWDALRTQLDDHPITTADGRVANQTTMDVATSASLYSRSEWSVLADALAKAEKGDASGIFTLADAYEGRHADGTFDTLQQSFQVIDCASGIEQTTPPDPQALLDKIHAQAPRMGATVTLKDLTKGSECAGITGHAPQVALHYSGKGPIVVVGGTRDPATPIRWAQEMTKELGASARLVTFTGEGHGQLLVSTCVTDAESAVLIRLTLPANGKVCDPDPALTKPEWWGSLPVPAGFSDVVSLPAVNAALGLTPAQGYGETRTTSADAAAAMSAYDKALVAAGFLKLGSQDLHINDTLDVGYQAPNGDILIVLVMGPKAFDTPELQSAKSSVPAGKTVVLSAYVKQ
jgi:pimeloyl-ACP methyl ester carboxylesterase